MCVQSQQALDRRLHALPHLDQRIFGVLNVTIYIFKKAEHLFDIAGLVPHLNHAHSILYRENSGGDVNLFALYRIPKPGSYKWSQGCQSRLPDIPHSPSWLEYNSSVLKSTFPPKKSWLLS